MKILGIQKYKKTTKRIMHCKTLKYYIVRKYINNLTVSKPFFKISNALCQLLSL